MKTITCNIAKTTVPGTQAHSVVIVVDKITMYAAVVNTEGENFTEVYCGTHMVMVAHTMREIEALISAAE